MLLATKEATTVFFVLFPRKTRTSWECRSVFVEVGAVVKAIRVNKVGTLLFLFSYDDSLFPVCFCLCSICLLIYPCNFALCQFTIMTTEPVVLPVPWQTLPSTSFHAPVLLAVYFVYLDVGSMKAEQTNTDSVRKQCTKLPSSSDRCA